MVLIIDGNAEIGAQVGSNLCYLICLKHLIISRAVTNRIFSPKRTIFLHACPTCSELPSYIGSVLQSMFTLKYSDPRSGPGSDGPRLKVQ